MWFSERLADWKSRGIDARLEVPDQAGVNKAAVTLEAATHVGSITARSTGTVELIVLDLLAKGDP